MKKPELYDHVMTPTGRFGEITGHGEFVATVRVKFVDGTFDDVDPDKLIVVDPDFVASHHVLLEACKAALDSKLHWNAINSMLRNAITKATA